MRISDWSSDVCSSDLLRPMGIEERLGGAQQVVAEHVIGGQGGELLPRDHVVAQQRGAHCVDHHGVGNIGAEHIRSEEHTSELQSLMRISYAVFCLKKKHKSIRM